LEGSSLLLLPGGKERKKKKGNIETLNLHPSNHQGGRKGGGGGKVGRNRDELIHAFSRKKKKRKGKKKKVCPYLFGLPFREAEQGKKRGEVLGKKKGEKEKWLNNCYSLNLTALTRMEKEKKKNSKGEKERNISSLKHALERRGKKKGEALPIPPVRLPSRKGGRKENKKNASQKGGGRGERAPY